MRRNKGVGPAGKHNGADVQIDHPHVCFFSSQLRRPSFPGLGVLGFFCFWVGEAIENPAC